MAICLKIPEEDAQISGSKSLTVDRFEDGSILIGKNIRKIRTRKRLRLRHMSIPLGVSEQSLSRYELGQNRISAVLLFRIAILLDIDINELFQGVA